MTEEERKRANAISNWLDAHPGVNYHIAPQNLDGSYHIIVWRGEEIWIGPDYIVSEDRFKKIADSPIDFLDKAYLELVEIEKKTERRN